MADLTRPANQQPYADVHQVRWSAAEKAIARRAFDAALQRELQAVIEEAKKRAARIGQPSELWELEEYLRQRRRAIDRTYDYRYSVLPMVFGILIRQGHLREQELNGLAEDKLTSIRQWANL